MVADRANTLSATYIEKRTLYADSADRSLLLDGDSKLSEYYASKILPEIYSEND